MIDPIERLDVIGLGLIAGLALFVVRSRIGLRLPHQSNRTRRCAGASAEHAQKIAAVNLGFVVLFHRYSSLGTRSQRQRKRVRFDFNENTAHSAYWLVEFRGLRTFEIGEEAPRPWRNVVLEDRAVRPFGRRQVAA